MHHSHPRTNKSFLATHTPIVAVVAAAVVVAMIVVAPSARAQSRKMALTAFGGYNIASDIYDGSSVTNGNSSLELKNDFMWGGRATAFTNEYSAVEFGYTRTGSDLAIKSNSGVIPNGFDAGRLTADQYDLNFLVSQPTSNPKLWPYFTLGLGWTLTHPDIQGLPSGKSIDGNSLFAFNFGVGTMVEMNPKLAVRVDARWRVTDTAITTSSGVYCDYWGYCYSYSSDWYNSGEFTAGLTYRLGS